MRWPVAHSQRDFWLRNILLPAAVLQNFDTPQNGQNGDLPGHLSSGTGMFPPLVFWPNENDLDFPGDDGLDRTRADVAAVANIIAHSEPVWAFAKVDDGDEARGMLSENVTLHLYQDDTDAAWSRRLRSLSSSAGLDMDELEQWEASFASTTAIGDCQRAALGIEPPSQKVLHDEDDEEFILDFIQDVSEDGTVMMLESVLDRIPSPTEKDAAERCLEKILAAPRIIWIPDWLTGDRTCYSTTLARFAGNDKVVLSRPRPHGDAFMARRERYEQTKSALRSSYGIHGRAIDIIEIEEADDVVCPITTLDDNIDHAASYLDYIKVNNQTIVPQFGIATADQAAVAAYQRLWPDEEIVPIFVKAVHNGAEDFILQI